MWGTFFMKKPIMFSSTLDFYSIYFLPVFFFLVFTSELFLTFIFKLYKYMNVCLPKTIQ